MSAAFRRRAVPALALFMLVGLLAGLVGCGTPEPPHPAHETVPEGTFGATQAPPPAAPAEVPAAIAPDSAAPAQASTPSATAAAQPEVHPPAAETAPPAEPRVALPATDTPQVALAVPGPLPGPEKLVGLTGTQLTALLGVPGFVRRDAPAEIWQYRDGDCVLDLFLYAPESKRPGPPTVTHYEFRGRTVESVSESACYLRLLAAARRAPGGG